MAYFKNQGQGWKKFHSDSPSLVLMWGLGANEIFPHFIMALVISKSFIQNWTRKF